MRRHTPTLYPLSEQERPANDDDDDDDDTNIWNVKQRSYPSPPQIPSTPSSSRLSRISKSIRSPSYSGSPNVSRRTKYSDIYSQFLRRYRSGNEQDDPRNDPDNHYFQRGFGQLTDAGDNSDDEEDLGRISYANDGSKDRISSLMLESEASALSASQAERERLEWQTMFASVMGGDVLKSEKTRIAVALESLGDEQTNLHVNIWLGLRAKLHARSEREERQKLEEKRIRIVNSVLDELLYFRVPDSIRHDTDAVVQRVIELLRRLDLAQSLYPSLKAFYLDKPQTGNDAFQQRRDALNTWFNTLYTLKLHIGLLRRWTGSDTLDITRRNTCKDVAIKAFRKTSENSYTDSTPEIADGTSFVERVLKEESLQRTFEKGFLVTVHAFVGSSREAQITLAQLFDEMNLPTFERELVPLISFPTKLAQASLRMRLEYIKKLKDPDMLIVEQTMDDLKLGLGLACTLKRQYEDFLTPEPGGTWSMPECLCEDYDSTILEALATFFKLLHMKLKSAKGMYIKETDVLEAQWATLNDVSSTVPGGSCVVAENLCSLVNKLMIRMTNYFDTQVRVPMGEDKNDPARNARHPERGQDDNVLAGSYRKMTPEQIIGWYGKVLDSVRLRYRKLQRFTRALTQRFSNSAEYSLEDVPLDHFIATLVASEHFLVYTQSMEEEGIYIVAPISLYHRSDAIRQIINESYTVDDINTEREKQDRLADEDNELDDEEEARYVLILSPRNHFLWNGRVMLLNIPKADLDTKDDRVRLVADGPQRRLALAKQVFKEIFEPIGEDGEPIKSPLRPPPCVTEAQAHFPAVDRELRKIGRAAARLAESIVDSVHIVRSALRSAHGYQELMENWYLFASEHGQHAQRYMDRSSLLKFNRLLVKLAISWVSFICDDCEPTDRKTFKWAVNALEFTLHRTKRNILQLPNEQFEMLRAKVATCMTLLINHFDILGAKSMLEAKRDKDKHQELGADDEDDFSALDRNTAFAHIDPSTRFFWERATRALHEREEQRAMNIKVGRVLNVEKPEDRSLVFLASSSTNISIRWQQGRFIGAGAFGSVYLAVNLDSGTLMAVKEIKFQELTGMPNLYSQIKDELSVMEMLHHPNVVEYYGIEVHRDRVYIFEEYCQGGSLAQLLEHGRIEDEGIIQVYTMQMLEGLVYLHSKGIIHRDIKPDNILLDHLGVIKFVDFGAAKILVKNQRSIQRSRRGSEWSTYSQVSSMNGVAVMSNGLTGTPMYMSPEVIKNDKRGRHGSMDIWSLGCVVLEVATGKKPWSNLDNEWAIMFHIGVATQHPPLPEPSQLSEMGINFIKQCLTIDPMHRPTATELMDHPWMLEFREALLSYEEAELATNPPAHLPSDESYEHALVARQAAIIQEREVEQIQSRSPKTPPSILTPTNLDVCI
ncbi:hypothetical protein AX17_000009 [Amanita inopinata Kibby_2008]|nr:hypothetical protein AX17_000009 [Amanita inopinata Kibby_2008]